MISLRLLVFFHAHPEKIQWIRNASFEYWHQIAFGRGTSVISTVTSRWSDILEWIEKEFPGLYDDIIEITKYWDHEDNDTIRNKLEAARNDRP